MVVPLPRLLALALAVCFSSGTQAQPSFPPLSDYTSLGGAYWNTANVDPSVIPSGNSARTIAARVFLADNSTSQAFWGQNVLSGPCNSNELSLGFNAGSFFGTACNVNAASSPAGSYPVGTWYHVAFTWDSVAQAGTVFVNGQPGNPVNWNTPLTTATDRVVIGARVVSDSTSINGLTIPWQGVVASVHVYPEVLTQAQILADMNGATPLPAMIKLKAVVKAHWPAVPQVAWRSNTAHSLPMGLPDSFTPSYQSLSGQFWDTRSAPPQVIPSGNSARTITAWVYLPTTNPEGAFWGQNALSGPCNSNELSLGFSGGSFFGTACNVNSAVSQSTSYKLGAWYHVAFTWNSIAEAATVFVNGQPGNTANWNTPLATSNDRVVIGARVASVSGSVNGLIFPWQGVVASVTTYGLVLTTGQIIQDMAGNQPFQPTLALQATAQPTWILSP